MYSKQWRLSGNMLPCIKGACLRAAQRHHRHEHAAASAEDLAHAGRQARLAHRAVLVQRYTICRLHDHCAGRRSRVRGGTAHASKSRLTSALCYLYPRA